MCCVWVPTFRVLEIHCLGIDNIVQLSNKAKSYYHFALNIISIGRDKADALKTETKLKV